MSKTGSNRNRPADKGKKAPDVLVWLRGSLKRKLAATFSVIIIMTVALVASFGYFHTSNTIRQDAQQYSKQILGQANLNLARYYKDSELFFKTLAASAEFRKWLLTPPTDNYDLVFLMKDLESRYIEPYVAYHPDVLSIVFYNENGNQSIYRSGNPNAEAILMNGYTIKQENWLQIVRMNGEVMRSVNKPYRYSDSFGKPVVIPVMTFAQKFQFQDQVGILLMDISLQPTNEILNAIMEGNRATAMISDGNGKLIASPDRSQITAPLPDSIRTRVMGTDLGHFFEQESRSLVIFEKVPETDWKMIVQVPYDEVARSIYVVRNFTVFVTVVCLALGLFLVLLVSSSITRRIQMLRRTIRSTELGNFDVRVPEHGIDEVAALARTYNNLLDRIEESIHQLAESRLVHQKAILSALQSQINSHFLYNALESINAMANIAGHTEIRQTALALSKLLRYTSNYKQVKVTLKEEVTRLRDYVQILKIVYGDRINCRIDLPVDLEDASCLKALLQPIVENSVKHGYEKTGEKLDIHIRIERTKENDVFISVEDNGPGFDPEKLSHIRARLQTENPEKQFSELDRVGLLNLHYRLRMVYSDSRTGLRIPDNSTNRRSVIQIVFPYRKEMARN